DPSHIDLLDRALQRRGFDAVAAHRDVEALGQDDAYLAAFRAAIVTLVHDLAVDLAGPLVAGLGFFFHARIESGCKPRQSRQRSHVGNIDVQGRPGTVGVARRGARALDAHRL